MCWIAWYAPVYAATCAVAVALHCGRGTHPSASVADLLETHPIAAGTHVAVWQRRAGGLAEGQLVALHTAHEHEADATNRPGIALIAVEW